MEMFGLLIIYDGQIVYESYGCGVDVGMWFIIWLLVKLIILILVGIVVVDGLIVSVDDLLEMYLLDVVGMVYEGVIVKQVL